MAQSRDTSLIELPDGLRQPVRSSRDPRYVVGVDGGATKTRAVLYNLAQGSFHTSLAGPSNADAVGFLDAINAIQSSVDDCVLQAGIAAPDLDAVAVGISGADSQAALDKFRDALLFGQHERTFIVNDVVVAWAAATGCRPGVGLISGTGANSFGVNARGESWRSGGWGHVMSDEGSGYWIGMEGIRAAVQARDGRGPQTSLIDVAPNFYGVRDMVELKDIFYGRPLEKDEIGAFAVEVERQANTGDEVARSIVQAAGKELSKCLVAIVDRLDLRNDIFEVGLTGGIAQNVSMVQDELRATLAEIAPKAKLVVPTMPTVGGALLLALLGLGRLNDIDIEPFENQLTSVLS